MDAFFGYNQIRMALEDEEKTTFITNHGLYCYRVMPFGLKNAGATYQRLVNEIFKEQINCNMEVYVDDMLIKSKSSMNHVADLEETFSTLRKYKMKLNPVKCAFGVISEKFLGFMVSEYGIEVLEHDLSSSHGPWVQQNQQRTNLETSGLDRRPLTKSAWLLSSSSAFRSR